MVAKIKILSGIVFLGLVSQTWAQSLEEQALWDSGKSCTAPAEVRAYLDAFPNGRFVKEAGACLERPTVGPAKNPVAVEGGLSMTRAERKLVQQGLNAEALNAGTPDGLFGEKTRTAIRTYQRKTGARPTGDLTPEQAKTLIAIGQKRPQRKITTWDRTFGGTKAETVHAIVALPDGGFVAAGVTMSTGAGNNDAWILRLNGDGKRLWDRTFGGNGSDGIHSIVALPDGGFAAAGFTESKRAWILRLDGDGNRLWDRTFRGKGEGNLRSIVALPDGGFVVAGHTVSGFVGWRHAWILRLDGDGNPLWDRYFGGQDDEITIRSIVALPDGSFVAAGVTATPKVGRSDAWILRLDGDGNRLWERTFGGEWHDQLLSIVDLPDGGFVAAGFTMSKGAGNGDAWILRLDRNGNRLWDRYFGGTEAETIYGIVALPDGGFAAAGSTRSKGAGNGDAWILRLNGDGKRLWDRTFGGEWDDKLTSIVALPDGGFAVAGDTMSKGADKKDAWILQLDGDGQLRGK